MSYKELVIIDNEKVSTKNNNFYCDNFEAKISEDFEKVFNVTVIARKSKINRACQINLKQIEIASNIFSFLFNIFRTFKKNNVNYLIVAINNAIGNLKLTFLLLLWIALLKKIKKIII